MERKRGERYGEKFRPRVVKRMNACDNIVKLSRKLGVHRRLLYKRRVQALAGFSFAVQPPHLLFVVSCPGDGVGRNRRFDFCQFLR